MAAKYAPRWVLEWKEHKGVEDLEVKNLSESRQCLNSWGWFKDLTITLELHQRSALCPTFLTLEIAKLPKHIQGDTPWVCNLQVSVM